MPKGAEEMPTVESNPGDGAAEIPRAAGRSTSPPLLRRLGWLTFALVVSLLVLIGLGFVWFIRDVPAEEVSLDRNADGIELLASGRGKRLLISGAYRATNSKEISRLNPEFERWVRCCVDFDRSLNTLGNAIETKRWAERRGFRSLIVVTSNYHMPRALAEIAHQLPDVALVPFPVVTDRQRAERWWASGASARRMVTEYVKYVFAKLRMGLNPGAGSDGAS